MRLVTRRLELRPLSPEDLDRVHAHWSLPGVRRWLWDDESPTRDQVAAELAGSAAGFAERGVGLWRVSRDGVFVGVSGLREVHGQEEELEIVFSTEPSEWRRGYAFEAAEAVLRHAFEAGLERILGRCDVPNEASRRLLDKLGTLFDGARLEGSDDYYYRYRLPRP